jgi:hypothetical protein
MGKNVALYEIIFLYAFNQLEISKQGRAGQDRAGQSASLGNSGMWESGA